MEPSGQNINWYLLQCASFIKHKIKDYNSMQLIQISDLHITADSDSSLMKHKIDKLFDSISLKIKIDEKVVLCVLGDVIDKGEASALEKSKDILNYLKRKFQYFHSFKTAIVPGNHDLYINKDKSVSVDTFNNICDMFDFYCRGDESCKKFELEGVDVLLINSVFHHDYKYGNVDIAKIEGEIAAKNSLLIMHHSVFNVNNDDGSSIRNGYKILNIVNKNSVIGILHGHTHGYRNVVVGDKCRIIGVGPFYKPVDDINNQFNVISIDHKGIYNVDNYFFRGDVGEYGTCNVFSRKLTDVYFGTDLKDIYDEIKLDIVKTQMIQNFHMKAQLTLPEFERQIYEHFSDTIETATKWQNKELSDDMYYNHRQYMTIDGKDGIDFVINELNAKSTSSRAIIPLIDFKMVIDSGDRYLPSFNVIQFGFNDEERTTLIVTLYLRALEVNYFLKINLCELYLMSKEIAKAIRSVRNVDINIHAFRAQYKEKFGCFAKAKIDLLSSAMLMRLISEGNNHDLVCMLREKVDFCETIVNKAGIIELRKAFEAMQDKLISEEEIFSSLEEIEKAMDELEMERRKTSNYHVIKEKETNVQQSFNALISLIERGEFYDAIRTY